MKRSERETRLGFIANLLAYRHRPPARPGIDQNLTRKLTPPVNWLRLVCVPLTPKASAPAKSPRISGRMSSHLTGCQLSPRVTSA